MPGANGQCRDGATDEACADNAYFHDDSPCFLLYTHGNYILDDDKCRIFPFTHNQQGGIYGSIDETFSVLEKEWGGLDFVVHAIGWADKQYLRGRYVDTPREAFLTALDISCYSFTAVARRASALMKDGGSLLTLSYLGAERVMPHYNVMGVAKAALEASVRYMAADRSNGKLNGNVKSLKPISNQSAKTS